MSTLSQFAGGAPTTSIVNAYSSGGVTPVANINANISVNGAKEVLSGALTASTLATVLSVTGGGVCNFLSVYSMDGTARTIRAQVIVDGQSTPAFDASVAVALTSRGLPIAGSLSGPEIRFNSSLVVKVSSSLTETDKVGVGYILFKR